MTLKPIMRALRVEALGENYEGCHVREIETPTPGPGEVLVEIRAASLGFPDLLMTRGGYQHKPELPFTPGGDVAGTVAALGEGVSNLSVGDRVVAGGLGGGFAEYGVYEADRLRRMPDHVGISLRYVSL